MKKLNTNYIDSLFDFIVAKLSMFFEKFLFWAPCS